MSKFGPLLSVLIVALAFALTAWHSAQQLGTHWDEQVDLRIARALIEDPLQGIALDESQGRLPMYITALALALARPESHESTLFLSRSLSIAAGAATILVAFVLAHRWFGTLTALISAVLLAASPYFLGFSRLAMTESDAFCPAPVLLVGLAFDRYRKRRDSPAIILVALAIGVALAAKFLLICLFAPLILCDLIDHLSPEGRAARRSSGSDADWRLIIWSFAAISLILMALSASWLKEAELTEAYPSVRQWVFGASALLWGFGLAIGLVLIHDAVRRNPEHRMLSRKDGCWTAWAAWLAIIPLSGVFCLALFPEHVFNVGIAGKFLSRLLGWDGQQPLSEIAYPARLYGGIILFKLGPPLGAMTILALVWAVLRSPHEFAPRFVTCVTVFFMAMLMALPLWQTFYLMSIYPLLVITLSAFLCRVFMVLRSRAARWAWAIAVMGAVGWLLIGDIRVYPAFGYYGFETIGSWWMDGETRGYRNIVHVTNDGTEEALGWCNEHVAQGQRVLVRTTDSDVARTFAESNRLRYELIIQPMKTEVEPADPEVPLDSVDYVVSHHTRLLHYFERPLEYQESTLLRVAHVVWRGRGIYRMPVVTIFQHDRNL